MRKFFCAIAVVVVLFTSVLTLYRNGSWKDQLTMAVDMVAKSPLKARTHTGLGMSLGLRGEADAALREYEIAMRLEPTYTSSYAPAAVIYGQRGELLRSIAIFTWLIELDPTDHKAHTGLGAALMLSGALKEAEREFELALESNPYYERARDNLSIVRSMMRERATIL